MIKPSHYDDDGYVIQWLRSGMPSNSLAMLHGLASDCAQRQILGEDVGFKLSSMDETNTRVRVKQLARMIQRDGGLGLVGLVGVQSNQFPHALDLARQFRAEGIQVCIGGFHVSGCLAMLPGLPKELQEALDMGVSLFAGEAEGRLETVLTDAFHGRLKPIYNYMSDLPNIQATPMPILDAEIVKRTAGSQSSFDAGRGCPFMCSFCTIINVQGRLSRFRSEDDVEKIIRENVAQGIKRFFITDDNFARNRNWEPIFDRLIHMREVEGLKFNLVLQVDTACHRIKSFIEKAQRAGVKRVFIGLENINPDSLAKAQKVQNKIADYRKMLQAWRKIRVVTVAGYITGFPGDTPESILRDVETVKRELPIDLLEFFFLTPLPGSQDHKELLARGVEMDPDLNKYDLDHVTTGHDTMSKEEWEGAYLAAWNSFYSPEHIETLLKRARADRISLGKVLGTAVVFYSSVMWEGVHPLETGVLRRKYRRDRRHGMPLESPFVFYPKYLWHLLSVHARAARMYFKYYRVRRRLVNMGAKSRKYTDAALEPVLDEDLTETVAKPVTQAAQSSLDSVLASARESDR